MKPVQFDLKLEYFVSEPYPIGSGGDRKWVETKTCGDSNTTHQDGWKCRY